jgi:methionine sulfoxide reductase heme-binding subunit
VNAAVRDSTATDPNRARRRPAARRAARHAALLGAALLLLLLAWPGTPEGRIRRLSIATAHGATALLTLSLLLGPLNVLRRRSNPSNTLMRRDIGIWAAVLAALHTLLGLQVHMKGRMLEYFLAWNDAGARVLRTDLFGLTNHAGLLALLLLAALLAISNDFSLRRLGTVSWKRIQRLNYAAFALTVGHGAVYQLLERRGWPLVASFALLAGVTLAAQAAGMRAMLDRGTAHRRLDGR